MKLLYIKGLATSPREIETIQNNFKNDGIECEQLSIPYSELAFLKQHELKRGLSQKMKTCYPDEEMFNLICDTEGCTLGLLLAEMDKRIQKLVLVSPNLVPASSKERKQILQDTHFHHYYGEVLDYNPKPLSAKRFKEEILLKKVKDWAKEDLEELKNLMLILYAYGDNTVSQTYLKTLNKRDNITTQGIKTCNQNPLLSQPDKSLSLIKKFIDKKSVE